MTILVLLKIYLLSISKVKLDFVFLDHADQFHTVSCTVMQIRTPAFKLLVLIIYIEFDYQNLHFNVL